MAKKRTAGAGSGSRRTAKGTATGGPNKGRKRATKAATAPRRVSAVKTPGAKPARSKTKAKITKNQVTLIARDPVTAFAGWDVSRGPTRRDDAAVLRLLRGEEVERELPVSLRWEGQSVRGLLPGEEYRVELGIATTSAWRSLGVSNPIRLPARAPSEVIDDRFESVEEALSAATSARDPEPGFPAGKRAALLDLSTDKRPSATSPGNGPILSGRG
jgi:hypothetical protein